MLNFNTFKEINSEFQHKSKETSIKVCLKESYQKCRRGDGLNITFRSCMLRKLKIASTFLRTTKFQKCKLCGVHRQNPPNRTLHSFIDVEGVVVIV